MRLRFECLFDPGTVKYCAGVKQTLLYIIKEVLYTRDGTPQVMKEIKQTENWLYYLIIA